MSKGVIAGSSLIVAVLGWYAWLFTPDYIMNPDKTAPSHYLYDAKKVFNTTETRTIGDEEYTQTYRGACPDLSMQTSKALADSRLTIREVHDLHQEAKKLYDEAQRLELLNDALRAAGKPPVKDRVPDCTGGDDLFR